MIKWSRYIVLSISIGVIMAGGLPVARGCADISPEDYFYSGVAFVQSDLSRDSVFKQYYYDASNCRSETMVDEAIRETKATQNIKEWETFFQKTFSAKELQQLVYTMTAEELDRQLKKPAATGGKLQRPENRPALEYLLYAKQCEPYVVALDSDWENGYTELKNRREPAAMQRAVQAKN